MEPLRSNDTVLQVDMTTTATASQAAKKIKKAKFVPHEPIKAAVGPVIDKSPEECSITINDRFTDAQAHTPPRTPVIDDRKLHRYSKTVYIGKKPDKISSPPKPKVVQKSLTVSPTPDKFRPINVVDPIRQDHVSHDVTDDHVIEVEEYSESRAVLHLQAVNDACNQKIVQLRDERAELKKELELQFQINSELKNLLVASMGDEMHHDVEMLVRQRTQLSSEIENYCRKIQDNQETLDKMTIMADMWRSKYIASRVMVDELAGWKAQVSARYRTALHALLSESQIVRMYVTSALRYLHQIQSTLWPSTGNRTSTSGHLLDMCKQLGHLAETVKFKLLGNVAPPVEGSENNELTPAEKAANEVLSHGEAGPALRMPVPARVGRFHPDTRYELLTLNCCQHCKGDITVV